MESRNKSSGRKQATRAVHVIGRSCRLPGAENVAEFWQLLADGRCTVSSIPPQRFSMARYKHPRRGEPGKAYTFAAGVIDDVWGFDHAAFAISPREAAQMDPQQRLLLMLVWEALEDAGLPASALARRQVGVYVGNSGIDHNYRFLFDPAGSDSYMMTGNTGALISNRISYIFDLHGPSMMIDTACSSSLVALDQAMIALRSGQIDTAIVAGVNLMLSPFPFVGFSAASMLSPVGLSRAFDRDAYGYVRAEGGVVLILQRDDQPLPIERSHATIVETGVNSDGRTVGVALPSAALQAQLLREVYGRAGITPDALAFVEAHGTGTRVGDPAEAQALGEVLGKARTVPLPIGSVKSNIGHLEPASGIVGLLKAMLALEHDLLPATLHVDNPNPDIPFDDLNLDIAGKPMPLPRLQRPRFAGVSNFGFGGTNVHVIVGEGARTDARRRQQAPQRSPLLLVSAHCETALRELAQSYLLRLTPAPADHGAPGDNADGASAPMPVHEIADLLNAAAWQREHLPQRLAVVGTDANDLRAGLAAFCSDLKSPFIAVGRAGVREAKTALVYAGNGSQFAGMGWLAFQHNKHFRTAFSEVDDLFAATAGWSLGDMLFADDLEQQLSSTAVAQPLLFALQVALTEALRREGLVFSAVLGHSVGEVAAAWACGALSLPQAVQIIRARSEHQETMRGAGLMVAAMLSGDEALAAIADNGLADLEISAINSPRSVTLSGSIDGVQAFQLLARNNGWSCKVLPIEYPFHSALIDPIESELMADLRDLRPEAGNLAFYSTVTGGKLAGEALDGAYWWHNVRHPVRFRDAVQAAARDGHQLFVEIGPRPILRNYIVDSTADLDRTYSVVTSLDLSDSESVDPVKVVLARALASGASIDRVTVFGADRKVAMPLPLYPWQKRQIKLMPSSAGIEAFLLTIPPHRLLGQQVRRGEYVWWSELDSALLAFLNDHKVDGRVIMPGAGFAEMALAAGRQWLGKDTVELRDFDILQPLELNEQFAHELSTRLNAETGSLEIASRKRLSGDEWAVHARCRVAAIPGEEIAVLTAPLPAVNDRPEEIEALYRVSERFGLSFGPRFRRLVHCIEIDDNCIELSLGERAAELDPDDGETSPYVLHPLDLDGCFHGLNRLYLRMLDEPVKLAYVPVRLGMLRIYAPAQAVRTARIHIRRSNNRGIQADFHLFSDDGRLVALIEDARFRAAALTPRHRLDRVGYQWTHICAARPDWAWQSSAPDPILLVEACPETLLDAKRLTEQRLLLDAAARRIAYDALVSIADETGRVRIAHSPAADAGEITDTHCEAVCSSVSGAEGIAVATTLLAVVQQSGMVEVDGDDWQLSAHCSLPPATHLMQMVLAEEPAWLAESALLGRAAQLLPKALASGTFLADMAHEIYASSLLEQWAGASPWAAAHIHTVAGIAERIIKCWPLDRPLRVLELGVGGGALTRRLLPSIAARHGRLVVADGNATLVQRLGMRFADVPHFSAVDLQGDTEALKTEGPFDLLLSANGCHLLKRAAEWLQEAANCLAEGGISLVSITEPDVLHDILFAPVRGWLDTSVDPAFPLSSMRTGGEWAALLGQGGLVVQPPRALTEGLEGATLLVARRVRQSENAAAPPPAMATSQAEYGNGQPRARRVVVLTEALEAASDFVAPLLARLERECNCRQFVLPLAAAATNEAEDAPVDYVYVAMAFDNGSAADDTLGVQLQRIAELLRCLAGRAARLWVLAPGAVRAMTGHGAVSPAASALWAFARTASNEYGMLDIRLIDFEASLSSQACAERFAVQLLAPGDESELVLTGAAQHVLRLRRGVSGIAPTAGDASAAELRLGMPLAGTLDQLDWRRMERRAPEADEIEIAVIAAGLNFRDVMWAQGLLPEEALEDGFAGATLGFECTGEVLRVGKNVRHLRRGDRVMALAPACFASHVTVTAHAVAKLPEGIDPVAAATIPVAFLTAYYALHYLARVERDEWVLIHAAAGGVGLAALQIAKWRGARVIATAGNEEKRQFLKMLGADYVLNTRSLDFVDQINSLTSDGNRRGVDVVLNSLAGEAMERSLELLRPFGRFLELGKRDFYANSKLAMRPFRSNISYFGIDADQLLTFQPALSQRLFKELTDMFASRRLHPLPYRKVAGGDVIEAFRLMQQSGHIGKIVIQPPRAASAKVNEDGPTFRASSEGVHIVVGGLGGVGLEVANWLADSGARKIVLTSRSGTLSPDGERLSARLAARGVEVEAVACDVSEAKAIGALLRRQRRAQPIKGVIHAAMVLSDGLIQGLSQAQIDDVLRPKVAGVEHLDRLTRGDHLDYFVVFSSAAALFGNPGQAHYAAANAYLEGVMRRRRAEGLPAFAVAWGAITDVGVLARQKQVAVSLARHTGGLAFAARQGLDLLAALLADNGGAGVDAVAALAAMNWAFAGDTLPIMRRPAFSLMAQAAAGGRDNNMQAVDLAALIAGIKDGEARQRVARVLAVEIANIFRMPVEEINLKRPLVEIGMDSLMGMELRTVAQQKLGIDIPMVSIADGTSINDIATKVLQRLRGDQAEAAEATPAVAQDMLGQHVSSEIAPEVLEQVVGRVRQHRSGTARPE